MDLASVKEELKESVRDRLGFGREYTDEEVS